MGNRMIRDGVLESEAIAALPPIGRWLFMSILLSADDYGLFEASPFLLAKHASIDTAIVPELFNQMTANGLVRPYAVGGKPFGFVPKFRQRLRGFRAKCPPPPLELVADEPTFARLIAESVERQPADSLPTDGRLTGVDNMRPELEFELEGIHKPLPNGKGVLSADAQSTSTGPTSGNGKHRPARERTVPDCPHREILALWAEVLPALPQHQPDHWTGTRADNLRARWRELAAAKHWQTAAEGLPYFRKLFGYVGRSPFLTGKVEPTKGRRVFVCELAWLLRPQHWHEVHEGKYHDKG